jgi:hypothetical protein
MNKSQRRAEATVDNFFIFLKANKNKWFKQIVKKKIKEK